MQPLRQERYQANEIFLINWHLSIATSSDSVWLKKIQEEIYGSFISLIEYQWFRTKKSVFLTCPDYRKRCWIGRDVKKRRGDPLAEPESDVAGPLWNIYLQKYFVKLAWTQYYTSVSGCKNDTFCYLWFESEHCHLTLILGHTVFPIPIPIPKNISPAPAPQTGWRRRESVCPRPAGSSSSRRNPGPGQSAPSRSTVDCWRPRPQPLIHPPGTGPGLGACLRS